MRYHETAGQHTVTNDNGVDNEGQEGSLVLGSVLLSEGLGVEVADGLILRTVLGVDSGSRRSDESKLVVTHLEKSEIEYK